MAKKLKIFLSISDYKKVDIEKTITFITGVSYSKKKLEKIQIYNIMTKLADKIVTQIALFNKKQIRIFCEYLITSNNIV